MCTQSRISLPPRLFFAQALMQHHLFFAQALMQHHLFFAQALITPSRGW
jgi:hypothetical protein